MAGDELPLDAFRSAGRTLFSFGLVKASEGNLSVFDGRILVITKTGASLSDLDREDLATGRLDGELPGASSDLEVHRRMYLERGAGAVVHSHPPGTVPEEEGGPGAHGWYVFGASLDEVAEETVRRARASASPTPGGVAPGGAAT